MGIKFQAVWIKFTEFTLHQKFFCTIRYMQTNHCANHIAS